MAEDDLEYHVTFPSPTPSTEKDDVLYGDGAESNYSKREPVIILLGWVDCEDKHLAKYSAMYEQKGYITIRYTASKRDIFFGTSKQLKSTGIKILELLYDLSLEDNPIFFHVFSNGGGLLYGHITELLMTKAQHQMLHVHGTVFDSCPSQPSTRVAARAFTEGIRINFILKTLIMWTFFLCFDLVVKFQILYCWIIGGNHYYISYVKSIKEAESQWPQLFLYSKVDTLVDYKFVDSVIEYRRHLGVKVFTTCWDDSKHVQHLVKHRESYIQQCLDFVDYCLKNYSL